MKKIWLQGFAWYYAEDPKALHFDLELFLARCGWPNDAEHRATAENVFREIANKHRIPIHLALIERD